MAVAQRGGRARLRMGLLILTAVTLVTLDFRDFGPLETAKSRTRDILQPAASAVGAVLGPVGRFWTAAFDYRDLRAENEELRAQVEAFRSGDIRSEADREALEQLSSAVDVVFAEDLDTVVATVVSTRVGNFDDDVITIDAGRRDGVLPGMAVVTAAGMVGRIDSVDARQSTVTAISDPELVIGVRLLPSGDAALGHGRPGDAARFVIDTGLRWTEGSDQAGLPEIGSAVVTAPSSRYPGYIPIGRVSSVEVSEAGDSLEVVVDIAARAHDLVYVTVLLQPPADEPPIGPGSPFGPGAG